MQTYFNRVRAFMLTVAVLFCTVGLFAVPVSANADISPKVSIGKGFAVALKSDGTTWVWGNNANGVFGDPTVTLSSSSSPVAVAMPDGIRFCDVAAGSDHVIALDTNGGVWTWGANGVGQLGASTPSQSNAPMQVEFLSDVSVSAVAAGNCVSFALTSDGAVYAWGNDSTHLLGISTEDDTTDTPTLISAFNDVTVVAIYVGEVTVAARDSGGNVYLWGENGNRQAGVSGATNVKTPTVKSTAVLAQDVALGKDHTSFLFTSDSATTVQSIGKDTLGQFGVGNEDNKETAALNLKSAILKDADGEALSVKSIAAGREHMVAITDSGAVYTWGSNANNQLGYGESSGITKQNLPLVISSLADVKAVSVTAAYSTSAVIDENGYVYIWGVDPNGGLGAFTEPTRLTTASGAVFELGAPFEDIVQTVYITANATVPSPTFVVTIPATVQTADLHQKSENDTGRISSTPITVSASGIDNLFGEKQVSVYLAQESDPFLLSDGTHTLPYTLYNNMAKMENGGKFASFTANGSVTGRVEIDQSLIRHTGVYSDTVTFEVTVEEISNGEEE